jgi:hypothetical protein
MNRTCVSYLTMQDKVEIRYVSDIKEEVLHLALMPVQ